MKEIIAKSLQNAREISFYPMKEGLLYRGGALDKLSKKDARYLAKDLGIKAIIDLRTTQEAMSKPDQHIEGVAYYHINLITMEEMGSSSEKEAKKKILKEHRLPDIYEYYERIVSRNRGDSYRKIFDILLNTDGPIYFHCTAGKDRTGVLSALILSLLGIDQEKIYEDYLKTNEHPIVPFSYKVFAMMMDKEFRKQFKEYFNASKSLLDRSFEAIDRIYGSLANFYSEMCGLNEERILAFRKKYLREDFLHSIT